MNRFEKVKTISQFCNAVKKAISAINKKKEKLTDFGEKIGGARKDQWKARSMRVTDLKDLNDIEKLEHVRKDNIWPKVDYKALYRKGESAIALFIKKRIRDSFPAKPELSKTSYPADVVIEDYINTIAEIEHHVMSLETEEDFNGLGEKYRDMLQDGTFHYKTRRKILRSLDFRWYESEHKVNQIGWPETKAHMKGYIIRDPGYSRSTFYIVKGRYIIKDGFKSKKEAEDWLEVQYESRKAKRKKALNVTRPMLKNIERTGEDYRNGKNVKPDDMLSKFSFKGGEFGNWLSEKDRQQSLNHAYDAMMDLSNIMGMAPEDLSLSGRLSIAFGARGISKAMAHYEPGRKVINLTKMSGAGSLAHEFAHAFDHLLGDLSGNNSASKPYITGVAPDKDVFPKEVVDALSEIGATMLERKNVSAEEFIEHWLRKIDNVNQIIKNDFDSLKLESEDKEYQHIFEKKMSYILWMPTDHELVDYSDIKKKVVQAWKWLGLNAVKAGTTDNMNSEDQGPLVTNLNKKLEYFNAISQQKYRHSDLPTTIKSEYFENARKIDGAKAEKKPYWSNPQELFARAFESFIQDKTSSQGNKSDYLVHSTKQNGEYGGVKPYPEGKEREAINAAFENLLTQLKNSEVMVKDNAKGALEGTGDILKDFKIIPVSNGFNLKSLRHEFNARLLDSDGKLKWFAAAERLQKGDSEVLKNTYGVEPRTELPTVLHESLDNAFRKKYGIPDEIPRQLFYYADHLKKQENGKIYEGELFNQGELLSKDLSELEKLFVDMIDLRDSGLNNKYGINVSKPLKPDNPVYKQFINEYPDLKSFISKKQGYGPLGPQTTISNIIYTLRDEEIKYLQNIIEYVANLQDADLTHDELHYTMESSKIGESQQLSRFTGINSIDDFCNLIKVAIKPEPEKKAQTVTGNDLKDFAVMPFVGNISHEPEKSDVPKDWLVFNMPKNGAFGNNQVGHKSWWGPQGDFTAIDPKADDAKAKLFAVKRNKGVLADIYTADEAKALLAKDPENKVSPGDENDDIMVKILLRNQSKYGDGTKYGYFKNMDQSDMKRFVSDTSIETEPEDPDPDITVEYDDYKKEYIVKDEGEALFVVDRYNWTVNKEGGKLPKRYLSKVRQAFMKQNLIDNTMPEELWSDVRYFVEEIESTGGVQAGVSPYMSFRERGSGMYTTVRGIKQAHKHRNDLETLKEVSLYTRRNGERNEDLRGLDGRKLNKLWKELTGEKATGVVAKDIETLGDEADNILEDKTKYAGTGWTPEKLFSHLYKKLKGKIGESLTTMKVKASHPQKGKVTKKKKKAFRLQGRMRRYGLDIAIENKKGSTRKGTDPNGKKWEIMMKYPYGYIRGTLAVDSDAVDTYIGPDKKAGNVYVVHQKQIKKTEKWKNGRDSKGRLPKDSPEAYDEDKVMLCFRSKGAAIKAYRAQYDRPDLFLGPVSTYTVADFKKALVRSFGKKLPSKIGEAYDKSKEWIGVDLDGTLAEFHDWDNGKIGKPLSKMVAKIKEAIAQGYTVKIFTARAVRKTQIPKIKKWLVSIGLPELEVTNIKDQYMIELWDDRAVKAEKNTGLLLNDSEYVDGIAEKIKWIEETLKTELYKGFMLTPEQLGILEAEKKSLGLQIILC